MWQFFSAIDSQLVGDNGRAYDKVEPFNLLSLNVARAAKPEQC